jgi:hypothetical protein
MASIAVSWGDQTKAALGTFAVRARHRYPGKGTYTLEIVAKDRAGNRRSDQRRVRIG